MLKANFLKKILVVNHLHCSMNVQNYNNHIRFYKPHHFIFYPLILLLTALCIYGYTNYADQNLAFCLLAVAFVTMGWLSFMMRQHYALSNQNRIIRLEMRVRYYQLTNKRFELLENKLSFPQIAALRFAPDDELSELIERSLQENLSAPDIKKSIKNWHPDTMRV